MKRIGWLIGVCLIGMAVSVIAYQSIFRELIELAYQGKAPFWFNRLVQSLYPRFEVEKYRFSSTFFLQKADQVLIRFCLVQILFLVGLSMFNYNIKSRKSIISFWQFQTSRLHVRWLSVLFYSGMFFFSYEWYGYLKDLSKAAVFYKPLPLLKLLHIGFPSLWVIVCLFLLLQLSCIAIVFYYKPLFNSVIAAALFILLQGWLYSFEKLDHTFATFTYAAILMPFLLYEQQKAIQQGQQKQEAWPLQLICLCIAFVYLMAALEKLLISEISWLQADNFRSYIFLHQAPIGMWVAQNEFLCVLLPLLGFLFQLCFIFIFFFPKLKYLFLLSGIVFHAGTYVILHVGWYVNAWIYVYIFFIDWSKVIRKLRNTIQAAKERIA